MVVPTPTAKLGTTFILTTSPSTKLWVVVFAAETLVETVVVILSISPLTCSFWLSKKYNDELIPEVEPFV